MTASRPARPDAREHFNKLNLLVALDALLVVGSVGGAAEQLGITKSAMSRRFSRLKEIYNDPLLVRAGRKMVPTPVAESLRTRLRALAAEADAIMAFAGPTGTAAPAADLGWGGRPLVEAAPLSLRPSALIHGMPSSAEIARRLDSIRDTCAPALRLSKYISLTSQGPGQSRPLSQDEADDALAIMLDGEAEPIQVGALLMSMFYRGETAPELAGFVAAARRYAQARGPSGASVDLDWPAYLSPNVRRPPWFVLSARLVARAGHRVLIHGSNGSGEERAKLEIACRLAGIPLCRTIGEASDAVEREGIAYLPLSAHSPQLYRLLGLHRQFGTRSPVNLVVPLLNPLGAKASLLGVVRPSYRAIHCDAAQLLGWPRLTVLTSTRDVAELPPSPSIELRRLIGGERSDLRLAIPDFQAAATPHRMPSKDYWWAIWQGTTRDAHVQSIIVGTAALALLSISGGGQDDFLAHLGTANELWADRHGSGSAGLTHRTGRRGGP